MNDQEYRCMMQMMEAIRCEIRAATFAIRGVPNWDHKDTQPKVLRALDRANEHAVRALSPFDTLIA